VTGSAHATTLGIDLAAESENTGTCRLRWEPGAAVVEWVRVGTRAEPLDNDALVALIGGADATGIDAPFGWPRRFVAAVAEWSSGRGWDEPWDAEARRGLRLRRTDRWLHERQGRTPLSVSADSIAVCAMRASALLQRVHGDDVDRVGGPTFEVYPAAALRAWGLPTKGYKKSEDVRRQILELVGAGSWLDLGTWAGELVRTDHALDALISAVVARAARTGRTLPVPAEHATDAAIEGWIQVPATAPDQLVMPPPAADPA
jgi:hypothetical protein